MINYPNNKPELKSVELERFMEWAKLHEDQFDEVFNQLYDLIDTIHDDHCERPLLLNLETFLEGFHDCLENHRIKEEGDNVL